MTIVLLLKNYHNREACPAAGQGFFCTTKAQRTQRKIPAAAAN
jgi:hypothetical protein